jgi:hypothetical protein
MNQRGIEPGSIDTNYRQVVGAQSPEGNRRGMEPGVQGREQKAIAAAPPPLPPVPSVFDLEKAALIRRTGRTYCPIAGCEFEGKNETGLRLHLGAKHAHLDAAKLLREVRLLQEEGRKMNAIPQKEGPE